MGSIVKKYIPSKLGISPSRINHITLMPCFDKKLEASRDDFFDQETGVKVKNVKSSVKHLLLGLIVKYAPITVKSPTKEKRCRFYN